MKHKKWWLLSVVAMLLAMACDNKTGSGQADKLLDAAYQAKNYPRLMELADSLEKAGGISQAKAYYWLGYACDRQKQLRMAEFYWKMSLEAAANSEDREEVDYYARSGCRLANLLSVRGDYEATLKAALPVAKRLEELHCDSTSDYVNLLIYIGCCQAAVGQSRKGTEDGFERAYEKHVEMIEKSHDDAAFKNAFAGLLNIVYFCNYTQSYQSALAWIDRFGELLSQYEQLPGASTDFKDKQLGRFNIYRAIALEGLGKKEEAEKVYEAFLTTEFSKTPAGRINANDYLFAAGRWNEAADNYRSLDAVLGKETDPYTTENIQNFLLKKYRANLLAGRRDSAQMVSMLICDSLDGALAKSAKMDAREQASIIRAVERTSAYQAAITHRKQMMLLGALALLFLCFTGYTAYRRRKVREQAQAFKRLKADFGHLEAETTQKVTESTERNIARHLQELLPSKTLSSHPSMKIAVPFTAGQMPDGGFCDSYVRDGLLFVLIGDVAGQGTSSVMLATMVKAQFRTAAALERTPEQIASAIDAALPGSGESAHAIGLLVGVLDLSSGRFAYCDAGHPAPVLTGESITQLPVDDQPEMGKSRGYAYKSQEAMLAPGSILFLYNKGAYLAENADHQPFGEKRLLGDAVQATKLKLVPDAFVGHVRDAIRRFTGETEQHVNQALMAVQYK